MIAAKSIYEMNGAVEHWLCRLLENHHAGRARFPADMGLGADGYAGLAAQLGFTPFSRAVTLLERDNLLELLQRTRWEERQTLAAWLEQYLVPNGAPLHELLATGSLGFNHLWQDLGLVSRAELRGLMIDCFPELVRMNSGNMRWKKFFYRQICLAQGGEIRCRSPSCDSCHEREGCFAPEE